MPSPSLRPLLRRLRQHPAGTVFNPWQDVDPRYDVSPRAPAWRRENLGAYLDARRGRARFLLVAEAVGFRGAKFSGVAMTCERQLLQGDWAPHPRTSRADVDLSKTDQQLGVLEPTAMIVARTLAGAGVNPLDVVLWNTFPWHPHQPGQPLTNRTPRPAEVAAGAGVLREMRQLFPHARVIAIGKIAQREIQQAQQIDCPCVRHPANGGATLFAQGITKLLGTTAGALRAKKKPGPL